MAKNDENKKSYSDVELAARDLLKKLSNQYDADKVSREKKMADTLSEIPFEEEDADNRLSTSEFDKIFDKFSETDKNTGEIPVQTDEDAFNVTDEQFEMSVRSNSAENDDYVPASEFAPVDGETPVEENVDESKDVPVEETSVEPEETSADEFDDRENTNVFADRMAAENTIDSYKPAEELKNAEETGDFDTGEISDDDTGSVSAYEKDPADSVMMKAFGLDPRNNVEKDDSKKIFNEYSFSSTDEIDDVPGLNTTDTLELPKEKIPEEIAEKPEDEGPASFEYTEPSQKKDVFAALRQKYMSAKIKMIVAGLFAVLLLVIEALPTLIPGFDIFQGYTLAGVIVDLCITICCGALVFGQIAKSLVLFVRGKFNGDTVTLFSFILSFIVSLVAVIAVYTGNSMPLYNFAFAICAFISILFDFFSLRRDVYSFKIVSASEPKSVLAKLTRVERYAEEKEFGEYMGDYSDIYKVEETDFVSDFFKKRKEVPSCTKALAFLIPISLIAAIVAAVISATVLQKDIYISVSNGVMAYWFCAPVIALISFVYPMYLCSMRAYSYSSAIIGDATPENSDKISVITFTDSDAFPPERIKIKSVKVFENYHIENVIYFASSVFSKIGGPLATVFKQATLDSVNSDKVDIKEITDLGIDAFVEGRHIVIGQPSYMESQCFETMYEAGDEEYEGQTNKRVLYLACDEVVVAKFYIQYNVSADFLYIVRHLCREGICISVRSSDPCIDNDILYKNKIDPAEIPVRIIKGQGISEKKESISTSVGSIVSTGSRKGLIKTLLLCDKIMNIRKTNLIVKIVSMIIGMVVTGILMASMVAGDSTVSSLIPAAYQLFWMLPILIVSKIYI